jgi:alpha-D-xyloside xylohydrolase
MGEFPGDETADWSEASGIASLAPDMLNRAVGGAFGYTTDIGGYTDLLTGAADAELFTRWSEWAALTPFFRVHNSGTNGTRMPWSYGAATYRRWRALALLHRRAVPLMRRLWRAGRRTGMPVTRPLWLQFSGDRGAARIAHEWTLGRDVLVAPVISRGARWAAVYLPRGCWRDPRGGPRRQGPRRISVAAPLGRLPYFFRCGTRPF